MGGTEGGDQPDAGGIAPDQHRAARHQIGVHPFGPDHTVIALGRLFDEAFEIVKAHPIIGQGMGQIEDRVVLRLTVDAVQDKAQGFGQFVKHHGTALAHRGQLGRIAEEDQRRENLAQVVKLAFVQHRAFVDKADIQGLFAPLPALDEIAAAQAGGRERAGDRGDGVVKRLGAIKGELRQPLHRRASALAGQPFRDLFILRVIDRGIKDAVNGGRGYPT